MKHILSILSFKKAILLIAFLELLSFSMSANPGDTTWVTIYNNHKPLQYGNHDTVTIFPTGLTYRKIRLHYILGRYACPPNEQYCGDWDYTTLIHARPAGLDSVEIARVITPYAGNWALTKKHDYIIDITDYASVLQGSTAMRFRYEGYSWGFNITMRVEFIEGTPPREAISVKNIYDGYYKYGVTADPIENYLSLKTFSYTAPVASTAIKNSISGHGSDNAGCSEFCNKYYQLLIDNSLLAQKQIWRNDCGSNPVYDQNGTWVFDRSNWCPGAVVWPIYHDLAGVVTPNTTFSVDINMQAYTSSAQGGDQGYHFVSQLINYGSINNTTDVSIEDILAPTKDPNYFRNNPTCTNPIIKIKNTGSSPITSVVFSYGLTGTAPATYTWTGALNFLEEAEVTILPATPIFTNTVDTDFGVNIVSVNGAADQNTFNNSYHAIAAATSIYPSSFVIRLATNNATDPFTSTNETSWTLFDAADNIIAWRNGNANTTVYYDTISVVPGCYRFKLEDTGCEGYAWWFYPYLPFNPGNGSLRFDNVNAPSTIVNFPGDVGCGFTKYFTVLDPSTPVAIKSIVMDNAVDIYPNPANETAYIKFDLNQAQEASYRITDVNGRLVQQKSLGKVIGSYEQVSTSTLANGVYIVTVHLGSGDVLTKKLIIQK